MEGKCINGMYHFSQCAHTGMQSPGSFIGWNTVFCLYPVGIHLQFTQHGKTSSPTGITFTGLKRVFTG